MSDPTPSPKTLGTTLQESLQDSTGAGSSKRVIGFIAMACLTIGFLVLLACVAVMLIKNGAVPDNVVGLLNTLATYMMFIVSVAILGVAAEWATNAWATKR